MKLKGLSLFANVGIGETYLSDLGIDIVVANELLASRVAIYRHLHPKSDIIAGDITQSSVFDQIIASAQREGVNLMIATPPCQGMSIAGQMKEDDPRNSLIVKVMEAFNILKPDYLLIENVPQMLRTSILYQGSTIAIKDFIKAQAGPLYEVKFDVFNAADYSTPQYRKRTIVRVHKVGTSWPEPEKKPHISVKEVIGDLPSLKAGEKSSIAYHYAKTHNPQHQHWLSHTPTGKSAFDNAVHYPQKDNRRIKGFATTYKRMDWDKPAPTVTMANGSISSQNNVHPGRLQPDGTYSDARVLTPLELFRVMGLPDDWNPPQGLSDNILRHVMGEAVPPKMMHAFFEPLVKAIPKD